MNAPMKKMLLYSLLLLPILLQGQEQSKTETCDDCRMDCLCRGFFSEYLNHTGRLEKIHANWNEFFAEDLEQSFPAPKAVKSIALKFDGLGCIYPAFLVPGSEAGSEFLDETIKKKRFYKNSFYSFFLKESRNSGNAVRQDFISRSGFRSDDFKKVKMGLLCKPAIEYFDFIEKWNERFIPETVDEINKVLAGNSFKRIVVFTHGYNVPYSLAQLQGNVLLDSILSFSPDIKPQDILFIRLFWPAGNLKEHILTSSKCDYNNFERIATVRYHTYYSNRAYLAAIATRKIFQQLKTELPIDIITHSLGSTVATTIMIQTEKKLQSGPVSNSIAAYMKKVPLPEKKINAFLNAPSIPGVMTFTDMDPRDPVYQNYFFFIGYNNDDITLKKQRLKLFGKTVRFIGPTEQLSSTTLGCNRNDEVAKTIQLFQQKGLGSQVEAKINSRQKEHEFYCYIKQPAFKENLVWFLKRQ